MTWLFAHLVSTEFYKFMFILLSVYIFVGLLQRYSVQKKRIRCGRKPNIAFVHLLLYVRPSNRLSNTNENIIISQISLIFIFLLFTSGHLQHIGSTLDWWSTVRAINPAPGAMIHHKMHLISPCCSRPSIALQSRIMSQKHQSWYFIFFTTISLAYEDLQQQVSEILPHSWQL